MKRTTLIILWSIVGLAVPALVNLNDKNTKVSELSRRFDKFDFTKPDAVPDLQFTEVLWKSIKGENAEVPAPRRSAFLKIVKKDDDD